jgi:glycosyltransferase involved in cell wall biosynthesis
VVKVSIIIPTHNRAQSLPGAIESAKTASDDAEIIVVDDASTDETPEICRGIPGIRYLRLEQNVRQAGARNAGIGLANGEYLAFLDDDDLRLPNSIDAQVEELEANPQVGFVYGRVLFGDQENCRPTGESSPGECLSGDLFWRIIEGNFIHIPSVVTRKKLVEEVGLFDSEVTGVEDWLMLIRLSERHAVAAVEEPVAIYRRPTRTSSQTSSNMAAMCHATARALAKALTLPRALEAPQERLRQLRQRSLDGISWMLVGEAIAAYCEGNYRIALSSYATALRMNPLRAARPYTLKLLVAELRQR